MMAPAELLRLLCITAVASLFVAACAAPPVAPGTACSTTQFSVDDDFEGARRGTCRVNGGNSVTLDIVPEDSNVTNASPWYAFRLTPARPGTATVVLDYGDWEHRYEPKISMDGQSWTRLPSSSVSVAEGGNTAELRVPLDGQPVWVAAQELIMPARYEAWAERLATDSVAEISQLGYSRDGRPISMLRSPRTEGKVILLTGRQHPPEVSGAVAFFPFVERLFADDPVATAFRERYQVLAIPLLNPDGVVAGHWRHGMAGLDLNRDWGDFSQPETRLVEELLAEIDRDGRELKLFLDFHSTRENLFYTFPDDMMNPPDLFHDWFERARPRLNDYPFDNRNGPPRTQGVGKNYINERYGIPAATYEVGDETDRAAAEAAAVVFAEELMQLLLEQPDQ